jgi:hypothetical protein
MIKVNASNGKNKMGKIVAAIKTRAIMKILITVVVKFLLLTHEEGTVLEHFQE